MQSIYAEGLEGIHCVSAVILDDYEYPVGAITTIGPSFRIPEQRFEEIGKICVELALNDKKKGVGVKSSTRNEWSLFLPFGPSRSVFPGVHALKVGGF